MFQVLGADTQLHASCGGWRCQAVPSPQGDSQGTRPCLGQYLACVRIPDPTPGAQKSDRGLGRRLVGEKQSLGKGLVGKPAGEWCSGC